jgi:hypothetical protein
MKKGLDKFVEKIKTPFMIDNFSPENHAVCDTRRQTKKAPYRSGTKSETGETFSYLSQCYKAQLDRFTKYSVQVDTSSNIGLFLS